MKPRRKRTLTIRIAWDSFGPDDPDGYWLAHDDVWAYGTGDTPEAAVTACLESAREWLDEDASTLGGPAAEQYRQYREWFDQERPARRPGVEA